MSTGKPDRRDGSQLVEVIRDLLEESMVRPLCADLDRLPVAEEALHGAEEGSWCLGMKATADHSGTSSQTTT